MLHTFAGLCTELPESEFCPQLVRKMQRNVLRMLQQGLLIHTKDIPEQKVVMLDLNILFHLSLCAIPLVKICWSTNSTLFQLLFTTANILN